MSEINNNQSDSQSDSQLNSNNDMNEKTKTNSNREGNRFISFLDSSFFKKILPKSIADKPAEERRKFTLPIFIIALGIVLFFLLWIFSPTATKKSTQSYVPTVRVVEAEKKTIHIPVSSQGVISPKNEVRLVSLVSGPVTYVSPNFLDGGFVKKDELLIEVSDRLYKQDRTRVEANLARAKSAQFSKQSELKVRGTLRSESGKAQIREVNTSLKAAVADLEKVDDLIANTKIRATFDGIIRGGNIYNGQTLSTGNPIASIFTTEASILSLPLSDKQLSLISLPAAEGVKQNEAAKNDATKTEEAEVKELKNTNNKLPKVMITSDFGDKKYTWQGVLLRSAGGRNELNRLQYVIVEIPLPYASDSKQPGRPPLSPGFFVEAEIEGREFKDIIRLPRKALKSNQKVWGVDGDSRLVKYDVTLLHRGKDYIYVSSGISSGANVVVSDLEILAEGVQVNTVALQNSSTNAGTNASTYDTPALVTPTDQEEVETQTEVEVEVEAEKETELEKSDEAKTYPNEDTTQISPKASQLKQESPSSELSEEESQLE